MKVIISGGGTGGHIYPALAIAKGLKEADPATEILYVGTTKGLEAGIVPKEGIPFRTVTVEGLPRKLGVKLFFSLFNMGRGFFEATKIIREFRPTVVVGTGGYVCGPVVLAAVLKKIPALIHEQNAFPGVTNKMLALVVDKIAATFPDSVKYFKKQAKVTVTGLPIRPEILNSTPEAAAALGMKQDKFNILVVGGSRGARSINMAMADVIASLSGDDGVHLLHVAGETGYQELMNELARRGINLRECDNITVQSYLFQMPEALGGADMVICRAGATTLAEITAKGIPSILIPYPYAAENHQEYNAKALVDKGAARMIKDSDLTGDKLLAVIKELRDDSAKLRDMAKAAKDMGRPDALPKLVQMVQDLVK